MVVIIKFLCPVSQELSQFVLFRRTVFTVAYVPRLENLVIGNPYNRRENRENPTSKIQERCWVARACCIGV